MPASYVHQSIAQDVFDKIEPTLFSGFSKAAFLAGSEGPDPLFFTIISPKGKQAPPEVGHLIHEQHANDFFTALTKGAKGDALLMSFVMGFLTHYAADTTFHPFIYSMSFEKGKYLSNKHCKYEHVLDTLLYRRKGFSEGLPVQMAGYIALTDEEQEKIAKLLAEAIAEVFPMNKLSAKAVKKSFKHSIFICNTLRNHSLKKDSILFKVLYPTPIGPFVDSHVMPNDLIDTLMNTTGYNSEFYSWPSVTNATHSEWHSFWEPEKKRTESIRDLHEAAVLRAESFVVAGLNYMNDIIDKNEFDNIIKDMSYDSGLDWRKTGRIG